MKDVSRIDVGNWVWTQEVGRWGSPRGEKEVIREVVRLTPTQIICDEGNEYDRFKRYGNRAGEAVCQYSCSQIVAIATPEEIESVGLPHKNQRIAEKARRAKCDEMKTILPLGMSAWINFEGVWEVRIDMKVVNEEAVRIVAKYLSGVRDEDH